jgi:mono/diheme cytochrome c family protein
VNPATAWIPVLLLLASCGSGGGSDASDPTVSPTAKAEANEIFVGRCVTCHGENGQGDGPGSAALDPKPAKFGDPAWQASVTDEHIESIIKFGGSAVGKSPTMPPNPDLQGKPEVVTALRMKVRAFQN